MLRGLSTSRRCSEEEKEEEKQAKRRHTAHLRQFHEFLGVLGVRTYKAFISLNIYVTVGKIPPARMSHSNLAAISECAFSFIEPSPGAIEKEKPVVYTESYIYSIYRKSLKTTIYATSIIFRHYSLDLNLSSK